MDQKWQRYYGENKHVQYGEKNSERIRGINSGTVKEWKSPGYTSIKLIKPENDYEIYKKNKYRSMVGKVMHLVNKSNPICLNVVRELAKHFNNPTKQQHWKLLTR